MTECIQVPRKIYFKTGCTPVALRELSEIYVRTRAFLVTGRKARFHAAVYADRFLRAAGIRTAESVVADTLPTEEVLTAILPKVREFQPDVIVGIGGSGAVNAAKLLKMALGNPQLSMEQAAACPASIREDPEVLLVLLTTEPGSGANIPAVVLAKEEGVQVLKSPSFLPRISITDDFFADLHGAKLHEKGAALLASGIRAWCRPTVGEYRESFLLESVRLLLGSLQPATKGDPAAVEHVLHASVLFELGTGTMPDSSSGILSEEERNVYGGRLKRLAVLMGMKNAAALMTQWEKLLRV